MRSSRSAGSDAGRSRRNPCCCACSPGAVERRVGKATGRRASRRASSPAASRLRRPETGAAGATRPSSPRSSTTS
jgi:hypothetical protein